MWKSPIFSTKTYPKIVDTNRFGVPFNSARSTPGPYVDRIWNIRELFMDHIWTTYGWHVYRIFYIDVEQCFSLPLVLTYLVPPLMLPAMCDCFYCYFHVFYVNLSFLKRINKQIWTIYGPLYWPYMVHIWSIYSPLYGPYIDYIRWKWVIQTNTSLLRTLPYNGSYTIKNKFDKHSTAVAQPGACPPPPTPNKIKREIKTDKKNKKKRKKLKIVSNICNIMHQIACTFSTFFLRVKPQDPLLVLWPGTRPPPCKILAARLLVGRGLIQATSFFPSASEN